MLIKRLEELITEKVQVIGTRKDTEYPGVLTGLNYTEGRFVYFMDVKLNGVYDANIEMDSIREVGKPCVKRRK